MGGLFGGTRQVKTGCDEPNVRFRACQLGDISQIRIQTGHQAMRRSPPITLEGGGTGLDEDDNLLPALAEGLERYCTSVFSDDQFITASAQELGSAALDLSTIAVCSHKELSHPRCPLIAPDKNSPIRWVQAVSLLSGRAVYVPAVMVYLHVGYSSVGERISIPITTGCAAHRSYERALLGAILEVIERDALSLLWLQELPLPRIQIDELSGPADAYWNSYRKASEELEYLFFDATTDLGVPTLYSLQISHANQRAMTLVSCSTSLDPCDALAKVIRDMASCRLAFRQPRQIPANWDNFTDLFHGASYMARAEQAGAFNFLLKSPDRQHLSRMPRPERGDERTTLRNILNRFRSRGWDIYAVDLSTDEALRAGFRVVRTIIPALQPFSFYYRARYLGHPRLYEAPRAMGYTARNEDQLNQWPQPFS